MYQAAWIFFIYGFLGWCTEVSFAALTTGKFVNRGFLNGPVCPIYGVGVSVVLLCLEPLAGNLLVLFIGSVILTSALEWLTGFVLEKLFHQRWWDYSNEPFQLGGYICLRFSIAWGFACVFVVKLVHPSVLLLIRLVPHTLGVVLLVCMSLTLIVDVVATVISVTKLNRHLAQMEQLAARIRALSDEVGESLADKVLDTAQRGGEVRQELSQAWEQRQEELHQRRQQRQEELAQLRRKLHELADQPAFGRRRLLRAFPKMRSVDHRQTLEHLRKWMEEHRRS